jgi:hypothetical protein
VTKDIVGEGGSVSDDEKNGEINQKSQSGRNTDPNQTRDRGELAFSEGKEQKRTERRLEEQKLLRSDEKACLFRFYPNLIDRSGYYSGEAEKDAARVYFNGGNRGEDNAKTNGHKRENF